MCVEITEIIYRWIEPALILIIILYLIWKDYFKGRYRFDINSGHMYKFEVWKFEKESRYGRRGKLIFGLFKYPEED